MELGEALARLGKPMEAAAEFREALRLKGDFPEAERALSERRGARIAFDALRFDTRVLKQGLDVLEIDVVKQM